MKKIVEQPKIKLDLSYGDLLPDSEFIRPKGFKYDQYPWSLKNESVEEASSAYLFHRIPARQRAAFMEELYRVLIPAGKVTMIVPYWTSARAIQDPLGEWPPLAEQSFLYFNKQFRIDNKLEALKCDFDFVYGYTLDPDTSLRTDEVRSFWIKHYNNSIADLQVVLTKR